MARPRDGSDLLRAVAAHGIRSGPGLRRDCGIHRAPIGIFLTDDPLIIARGAATRFEKTLVVFAHDPAILHRIEGSNTLLHSRPDGTEVLGGTEDDRAEQHRDEQQCDAENGSGFHVKWDELH